MREPIYWGPYVLLVGLFDIGWKGLLMSTPAWTPEVSGHVSAYSKSSLPETAGIRNGDHRTNLATLIEARAVLNQEVKHALSRPSVSLDLR